MRQKKKTSNKEVVYGFLKYKEEPPWYKTQRSRIEYNSNPKNFSHIYHCWAQ